MFDKIPPPAHKLSAAGFGYRTTKKETDMENKTSQEQAREYVASVGVAEAKKSNHYLTAVRHCTCGDCFCCYVRQFTDEAERKGRGLQ